MLKILPLLFVLLSSISTVAQSENSFSYEQQPVLKWDDFKVVFTTESDSVDAFVSISLQMRQVGTSYKMGYARSGIYEAHAVVNRNSSWVKAGTRDSSTLRHLQYAFNLAELIAKKLVWEVSEAKIRPRQKKVDEIFAVYVKFCKQCLRGYYDDTDHGRNKVRQAKWEAMIDNSQLNSEITIDKAN
ncbi:hypothetical protein SAMN05216327_104165 [Dyadobacter sp. SG02]|nr:hypothetical protein SAMN05216327_104165 [Dyadobacter sp. SG02]